MFLPFVFVSLCLTEGVFSQVPKDLLMIDSLSVPEEQNQATLAGFTFDLVTTTQFNSMTTQDFSAYKAIIFGERDFCTGSINDLAFLETNKAVWSSAITGNIVLLGNDAALYLISDSPGAPVVANSFRFAAGQEGATGLYFSSSCYPDGSGNQIPLTALSYLGTFNLVSSGSYNAHIVASSPVLGTLMDADLQASYTVNDMFTAYPSSGVNPFVPVAIIKEATGPGSMTFGDGSSGVPYILTRGPAVCGDEWQPSLGEECDNGELNGVDGNECSADCKCVSGLPDGNGHCLPPPPVTTTSSSSSSPTTASTTESTMESTTESTTSEASTTEASTSEASTTEASTTKSTTESTTESTTSEASTTEDSITASTSSDDSSPESTTAESTTSVSDQATSESSTPGSSITITLSTNRTGSLEYAHVTTSTSSIDYSLPTTVSSVTTEMSSTTVRYANATSSTTSTSTFSQRPSDSSRVPPSFTRPDVSSISALDTSTSDVATSSSAGMGGQSSSTGPTSESGIPNTSSTSSSSSLIPSLASTNPLTTLESTSSFNSSAAPTSPSSTGTLPSTSPTNQNIQITFIIQVVFTTRIKRQLLANFAVINAFGIVESTPICQLSSLLGINAQGQMVSNSLTARALPAAIASGSGPFTFTLPIAGQVDTTFSASGGQLLWNNTAFANGNAIFAIGPASSVIEVFYSGVPPLGYQTIAFSIIPAISVPDACAALGVPFVTTTTTPGATTTTTPGAVAIPTPMPSGSLYPVGYEVIVYVTINTVLVTGSTVCLTTPTYTKTNMIYQSAVPGSPCYACLEAEKFKFPKNPKDKCTVVTSSCTGPNSALFTAPSAVYKPCQACVATTLPGPAITPGAPGIEKSPGFSPVKTVTIGGGQVIFGSMSMSGQVIPTAVAMPVPGNAPQVPGGQPAQPGVPAPYPPPNVNVNTKAPDAPPPVNVNTKPADVPPVIVSTKAAEAPPSQPTPSTVNTQTPVAPPDATQSTSTVSGASASVVGHLTFLYFILLGIIV